MSLRRGELRGEVRVPLNTLVALPNVSAPCPVSTCPLAQPDGTVVCWPCLPAAAADPVPVPALDTWPMLALGAALVAAALKTLREHV